jgi:hypothetical protein
MADAVCLWLEGINLQQQYGAAAKTGDVSMAVVMTAPVAATLAALNVRNEADRAILTRHIKALKAAQTVEAEGRGGGGGGGVPAWKKNTSGLGSVLRSTSFYDRMGEADVALARASVTQRVGQNESPRETIEEERDEAGRDGERPAAIPLSSLSSLSTAEMESADAQRTRGGLAAEERGADDGEDREEEKVEAASSTAEADDGAAARRVSIRALISVRVGEEWGSMVIRLRVYGEEGRGGGCTLAWGGGRRSLLAIGESVCVCDRSVGDVALDGDTPGDVWRGRKGRGLIYARRAFTPANLIPFSLTRSCSPLIFPANVTYIVGHPYS